MMKPDNIICIYCFRDGDPSDSLTPRHLITPSRIVSVRLPTGTANICVALRRARHNVDIWSLGRTG